MQWIKKPSEPFWANVLFYSQIVTQIIIFNIYFCFERKLRNSATQECTSCAGEEIIYNHTGNFNACLWYSWLRFGQQYLLGIFKTIFHNFWRVMPNKDWRIKLFIWLYKSMKTTTEISLSWGVSFRVVIFWVIHKTEDLLKPLCILWDSAEK